MFLFTQSWLSLWLSLYVLDMPFGLKMKSLILCSGENGGLTTSSTFDHFLLSLRSLFFLWLFVFLLLFCFFFFFFFLFDVIEELESTELFTFQSFVLFVYDNSNKDFNDNFLHLFAYLIELSIFIGLDIVSSCQLSSFFLLFFEFIYFQLMKTSL